MKDQLELIIEEPARPPVRRRSSATLPSRDRAHIGAAAARQALREATKRATQREQARREARDAALVAAATHPRLMRIDGDTPTGGQTAA